MMSCIILMFSPMYLFGIYPTWSVLIILGRTFCNLKAKVLVRIL